MSREENQRRQEFGYGRGRFRPTMQAGPSRPRSDQRTQRERDPDGDDNPAKRIRRDAGDGNSRDVSRVDRGSVIRDSLGHGGHSTHGSGRGQGIGRGQEHSPGDKVQEGRKGQDDRYRGNEEGQRQGNDGEPCNRERNMAGTSRNNGNERGQGAPSGRGARRGQRADRNLQFDLVKTIPQHVSKPKNKKQGGVGNIKVVANYFPLLKATGWSLYYYRVDFDPDVDHTLLKKKLFKPLAQQIGGIYIFDGSTLWTAHRIEPQNEPLVLTSYRTEGDKTEEIKVTIRFVHAIEQGDVTYLQFFNITIRKCLGALGFEQIGRYFYDKQQSKKLPAVRLELWSGFITSIRQHENQTMLCVDITHKVLRTDTCYTVLRSLGRDARSKAPDELLGSIVMTSYNRTTYRIDDIDWDKNPGSTFDMKGVDVTFAEYYWQKYGVTVKDMNQPLLVSRPTKRDIHRGKTSVILLIPELCQMTGLSDNMRKDYKVMKQLSQYFHQPPETRFQSIENFMTRIQNSEQTKAELVNWGLNFDQQLVTFNARELQQEKVIMKTKTNEEKWHEPDCQADWTSKLRDNYMFTRKNLAKWVIIADRDANLGNLIHVMRQIARGLGMMVQEPLDIKHPAGRTPQAYLEMVNKTAAQYQQQGLDLIFFVLPDRRNEIYDAVKIRCCVDFGIQSQGFQAEHLRSHDGRLKSVVTRVMVQINAKLGGEPWIIDNPLKKSNAMVLGFDVHHCGKRRGESIGALVCTTNNTLSKFYSTYSPHANQESLSTNLIVDFTKCLRTYGAINKCLPKRIIFYRGGVGDGTLSYVYNTELEQLKQAIASMYKECGSPPRFTMIIVSKKTNTRIALELNDKSRANPRPGTVVDDVITLPERWDFFLISQHAKVGTASPTSYNVIWDEQGLQVEHIQRFTFKMTHMYYNWSGTVAVPAVCQLAHKCAFYAGTVLGRRAVVDGDLANKLYYL